MNDREAISEIVLDLWPKQKLLVCLKNIHGELFVDVRKWFPGLDGVLRPLPKGIELTLKDWQKAIEKIEALIKEANSQ